MWSLRAVYQNNITVLPTKIETEDGPCLKVFQNNIMIPPTIIGTERWPQPCNIQE